MGLFSFRVDATVPGSLARAGVLETPHGTVSTPAFVPVATKATVKALTPVQVQSLGAQIVLANNYHLYLQPGVETVAAGGGLAKFMGWSGPTMTDSGGFQVFSLGVAFGKSVSKFGNQAGAGAKRPAPAEELNIESAKLATVDEEGVTFRSHLNGSSHRFTPESAIDLQHKIGADIIFAFDECPSPEATHEYQRQAMERTHRWAMRCLQHHKGIGDIVQGREKDASSLNPTPCFIWNCARWPFQGFARRKHKSHQCDGV